ncbi:MAG TPA: DUF3305 domain-containing protein [Xanthobacteraceae bacterium]
MTRPEPLARTVVGVVVERRKAKSPWADYVWRPIAVLPGAPDAPPWTALEGDDETTRFFAGIAEVGLYRSDTPQYRDNLASGRPGLWVVLRSTGGEPPYEIVAVTADPSEGEALTESGAELVEPVPMPESIRQMVEAFIAEHHVEQEFFKRKQTRADPEALARRVPAAKDDKADDKK